MLKLMLRVNEVSALNHTHRLFCHKRILSDSFPNLNFPTKVPQAPHISPVWSAPRSVNITDEEINLLERLSLIDLSSKEALKTLEDSIEFASKILDIDTNNVEPLYTVLEKFPLELREDGKTEGGIRSDILRNAKLTEEEYFVAPPGNIPLEQDSTKKII